MSVKNFFPLAALFIASGLTAQTPAISGTFVSTLGSDTLQIERFTRTRDKLEGDIVRRLPRVQVTHYVADLAGGRWKGMSTTVRRYGADPAAAPNVSIVALLADTTASLEVQRNGKADSASSGNRSFKGRAAATVPGSPPSIGVYEQILASNPPVGKDSVVVNLIGGAAANNATLTLV
ncbi:MAG TPA: hypothetical protein VFT21_12510, partial [Gemmatimonadaceae bacterium]|nr:hypothetical protein [Gemmatimonadaceae bacterium]